MKSLELGEKKDCWIWLIILAVGVVPYFVWPVSFSDGEERRETPLSPSSPAVSQAAAEPREPRAPDAVRQPREISAATDPVTDVLRRIRTADFLGLETVMTGRYLKAYQNDHEPVLLETTDLDEIRLVSRGEGWMFLEAPYTPEEELYVTWFPWDAPSSERKSVKLRMVDRDGAWKLEDVQVVTRP